MTTQNVIIDGSFEPLIAGLTDKSQRGILRKSLRRAAQQTVLKEARKNVRRIAGAKHAKSLTAKSSATNFKAEARIGAKKGTTFAKIGHLLEKGTQPHVVRAKGRVMVGRKDGIVYGRVVRNPGARAKPWLAPAWEEEKRPAVAKFEVFIVEEFDKAIAKGKR